MMAKSLAKKSARTSSAKKKARKSPALARKGKAAVVKPAPKRAKADTKAAAGALPHMTNAQIAEAFRRFQEANAQPKTEPVSYTHLTLPTNREV